MGFAYDPAATAEYLGKKYGGRVFLGEKFVCRPGHLSRLSGAAVDPVHSAGDDGLSARPVRHAAGADPDLSDLPGAVLYLAADRPTRLQILRRITLPLAVPGLISAGIFSFTLSWNEFIYSLAFIQSSEEKTVPVAILTELVSGDVYQWDS